MDGLIRYEPLGDSADPRDMIVENNDGTYSVRSLKEMRPSTITLIQIMSGGITNFEALYYLLPCVDPRFPLEELDPDRLHITSVRWNGKIKGRGGGFFPSSIFLSIRTSTRDLSVKIFRSKLHMTGLKSVEEGDRISCFVIDKILEARRSHILFIQDPSLTMQVSGWLENHSRGYVKTIEEEAGVLDTFLGPVTLKRQVNVCSVSWPAYIPSRFHDIASVISSSYTDICYTRDIIIRTVGILNIGEVCDDHLQLEALYTCMVNYNFGLCFKVDRMELATQFSKLGYNVGYHNVRRYDISIVMRDTQQYDDDADIYRKPGELQKLYETRISITENGMVKLSGGGGQRQENAYIKFMTDLVRISIDRPEIAADDEA